MRAARITAYNYDKTKDACDDFSMNVYWGDNYRTVIYVDGSQGRSTFESSIESSIDSKGATIRTKNSTVEKPIITILAISPLLPLLHTIDKCDVKTIEFLDTNEIYDISNIDIEDQGDTFSPMNVVFITVEEEPISKNQGVIYVDTEAKQAFWDNNNNGIKDIDGEARFDSGITNTFQSWQLYYESDGTTPATSGNVTLRVYAESQTGVEGLIGTFNGSIGVNGFWQAERWQSTQSIWDYFNVASNVGHNLGVFFDKKAFAEDNGYLSDEAEDRAVYLRFELSIEGSDPQKTTLSLVNTIRGAFSSSGVQSNVTDIYGVTTIGKFDQLTTVNNLQDTRIYLPTSSSTLITATSIESSTNFSVQYSIDTVPNNDEFNYNGILTTNGGFVAWNYRASRGADNFTLAPDDSSPITQNENIINFTVGATPFDFSFDWKYDRQTGLGGFPVTGDILNAGDARVLLDGVLVNTLPTITPATLQVLGNQSITLPDNGKHIVRIEAPLNSGKTIFTEFEVQLKALY